MTTETKVTHTPGPWQVISGPDGYSPAIATSDEALASTLAHSFRNEQDATICAAAPDLLEALEEMRDACAACFRVINEHCASDDMEKEFKRIGISPGFGVRAGRAIAKAKGGAA